MHEDKRRRSTRLHERKEQCNVEAEEMVQADQQVPSPITEAHPESNMRAAVPEDPGESDRTLANMIYDRPNNAKSGRLMDIAFKQHVRAGYKDDKLLTLVIEKPEDYPTFTVRDNLIWRKNIRGDEVLCLPRDRELLLEILIQAHETVGHFGSQRTDEYIRWWYWWPYAAKDVREFCATCNTCQCSKPSNKLPAGKHHPLPIPTKPWDSIGMDFIGPFPEAKGFNYLWVVICQMMSMVHLIPVHTTMTAVKLS